jgi:MFS family permease
LRITALTYAPQSLLRHKLPTASWLVLALLGFSVFLNYVDRGNLSIAAPLLKDELHPSASQLGILLSSFFWTYTLCQIPAGWLIDRFDVTWILAIGDGEACNKLVRAGIGANEEGFRGVLGIRSDSRVLRFAFECKGKAQLRAPVVHSDTKRSR